MKTRKEIINRAAAKLEKIARRTRSPLEATIEGRVDKYAKEHLGAITRKMNPMGFAFWPDRLFLLPGCPELWIEFKRPGKPLSEGQAELQRQLKAQGREVWTEDDAKLAIAKLNAWYVMMHNALPIGKPLGSPSFNLEKDRDQDRVEGEVREPARRTWADAGARRGGLRRGVRRGR